ncbi:MAG: hypothetical protein WDW38_007246 [Sanguina aurantia]
MLHLYSSYIAAFAQWSQSPSSSDGFATADDQAYWMDCVNAIDKPVLVTLRARMNPHHVMGMCDPSQKLSAAAGRPRAGKTSASVPCHDFYLSTKRSHPRAIVLVRIGEFYEVVGYDALVVCQVCHLNPMAPLKGVARAGCPIANLKMALQQLIDAGFTVARPYYMERMADIQDAGAGAGVDEFGHVKPLVGLSASRRGYSLMVFDIVRGVIVVTEGCSQEVVMARMHAGGFAAPVLLHASTAAIMPSSASSSRSGEAKKWEMRLKQLVSTSVGVVERYDSPDPLAGFKMSVRRVLQLNPAVDIPVVTSRVAGRPMPPSMSTVTQLGLSNAPGQPNLLDYVTSPKCPKQSVAWVRQLLLLPPSPHHALCISGVCSTLAHTQAALPDLYAGIPAARISETLSSQQGGRDFFAELIDMLRPAHDLLTHPLLESLVDGSLRVTSWSLQQEQRPLDPWELANDVQCVMRDVCGVVQMEGDSGDTELDAFGEDPDSALERCFSGQEGFRSRVEATRALVEKELKAIFEPLMQASQRAKESTRLHPIVKYSVRDRCVWVMVSTQSAAHKRLGPSELGLHHPTNRKGEVEKSVWSSRGLESALASYRGAVGEATRAANAQLQSLCVRLQPHTDTLLAVNTLSIIVRALQDHVECARMQQWTCATLPEASQLSSGGPLAQPAARSGSGLLDVRGMWPYWCSRDGSSTVANDVLMRGMVLLTGANMAGKSTLLRSICAVALLANAGLRVPAASASVPVPAGRGHPTLPGPAGSCWTLAGALLEWLTRAGCVGALATHLHQLVGIVGPLERAGRLEFWAMEVADTRGEGTQTPSCCDRRRRHARTPPAARNPPARCRFSVTAHPGGMPRRNATWKVRPGICYESLAFEVARREGLPESFIARSEQLYQSIIHKPPPPAAAFDASDPGLLAGQTTTGRTQQAGQSARGTPPPSHPGLGSEPDPGSGSADGGGGEGGCGAAGGMGASGRAAVQVRDHGTGSHWLARVGPRIIARRGFDPDAVQNSTAPSQSIPTHLMVGGAHRVMLR